MAFEIGFTGDPDQYLDDNPNIPSAIGKIVAGELHEEFVSSLYEWNRGAYERQWKNSLANFVNGADRAVLISWYVNPEESSNLQWWALYRRDDLVHVQSHLLWYRDLGGNFSVTDAHNYLSERQTTSENGVAISEWIVSFGDVALFYESIQ